MKRLTPEQRELLPSDADVAFYQEFGWYVSKKILTDEEIGDAIYGIERHYSGERDAFLPFSSGYLDWKPEDGDILRLNDYVSLQNNQIRNLVFHPLIGAISARLSGSRTIRLFHDQLVYKPPGLDKGEKTVVGWHTDRAYWMTCTSDNMLTAWIPFQDCDEGNGTITMIHSSHKWPNNTGLRTFRSHELEELEKKINTGGAPIVKVPIILEKGQVSFHHCLTIHGSYPNLSDSPRTALTIHMQDGTNRYRVFLNKNETPVLHINDMLCRKLEDGNPDYADPDICPILWTDD